MQPLQLCSPVTSLRGISTVRAAQLEKLGIRTLYDLITYFPRTYEDRTRICEIDALEPDVPTCFEAMVTTAPRTAHIRRGLDITRLRVSDTSGQLELIFFNQPYLSSALQYGEHYRFFGTLTTDPYRQVQNPVFEPAQSAGTVTGRLMPVYPLAAGLSASVLQKAIRQALDACLSDVEDILPSQVRAHYGLASAQTAYEAIHAPRSHEDLATARRRLVFEEFFIFSAGLQRLRADRCRVCHTPYETSGIDAFTGVLPFRLTGAQSRAIAQILDDLRSGQTMNRLVQGDVGSGKTVVAAAAMLCAIQNGHQAALLAPTEILARQHFASLCGMMEPYGIHTVLLTGSLSAAEKQRVRAQIASGAAQLIIGTHALMTGDVAFADLDLIVADEQHRFGVAQRSALAAKGVCPHLLVMSATPIPRTLALLAYGDLDVSVLDELPPGREKVDTFLVGENMRQRINAFLRKQCTLGGQAYVVCPAIEEGETESLKSAELWAETLQKVVFPDLRVGLLHGRMKGSDKDAVMGAFARHELDVLVSTTVIEVGVDVPNANLMVIENADRFGLSQLHQLRGRVGRGSRKSYCVLFTSSRNEDTLRRLRALAATNDGFRIAEEDLKLRGPGDFLGQRQHGLPLFKAADLQMDLETLSLARQAAEESLRDGMWREDPAYAPLCARIDAFFSSDSVVLN